jgi:hypothetical protein
MFILLVVVLVLTAVCFQFKVNKLKSTVQLQAVELSMLHDSVTVHKAKSGELSFKLKAVEVDKSNLKDALELAGLDIKKLKEQDIRWKKLVSTLQLELIAAGEGHTPLKDTIIINNSDTIRQVNFKWSNEHLSLDGKINDNNMWFKYRYSTGIDIFQTKEKNKTIVTVQLTDKQAVITTGNSITVTHKKRFYERPLVWGVVAFFAGTFVQ